MSAAFKLPLCKEAQGAETLVPLGMSEQYQVLWRLCDSYKSLVRNIIVYLPQHRKTLQRKSVITFYHLSKCVFLKEKKVLKYFFLQIFRWELPPPQQTYFLMERSVWNFYRFCCCWKETNLSDGNFNHLSRWVADAADVLLLCHHGQLKKLKETKKVFADETFGTSEHCP